MVQLLRPDMTLEFSESNLESEKSCSQLVTISDKFAPKMYSGYFKMFHSGFQLGTRFAKL
jgi:hypothetical protein